MATTINALRDEIIKNGYDITIGGYKKGVWEIDITNEKGANTAHGSNMLTTAKKLWESIK